MRGIVKSTAGPDFQADRKRIEIVFLYINQLVIELHNDLLGISKLMRTVMPRGDTSDSLKGRIEIRL